MRIVPTSKELMKTVGVAAAVCVAFAIFTYLALSSPVWRWILALGLSGLIIDRWIRNKLGSRRGYGTCYLLAYQWTRRNMVFLVATSSILSAVSLAMHVESRWSAKRQAAVRSCGLHDVETASSSVVIVEGDETSGSGFWVTLDTVITNNHVIDHNPDLTVNKRFPATILATDSLRDIALLSVPTIDPKPVPLVGTATTPALAEDVFAIGYPVGRNLTVSKGIVSALTSDDYDDRQYIQTDAAISPGSSGGPVVDRCGRVVGMATQTLRGAENVGYAITWRQLSARMEQMRSALESSTPEERELTYPSEQTEVVAKYYLTLGAGDLQAAYDFYSVARKARLPYDSWAKGLGKTVFIRLIDVRPGERSNMVKVHFYSTEEVEAGSWEWRTGEFEGTWTLTREGGLWKMNESIIKDITSPATPQ